MSFRLRRKTRPQADVEIYGGPLKQKRFDGGMNIDVPASEIKENEVAYASNVIFREFGFGARAGTIALGQLQDPLTVIPFAFSTSNIDAYERVCTQSATASDSLKNIVVGDSVITAFGDHFSADPITGDGAHVAQWDYNPSGLTDYNPGTGSASIIPYRRGYVVMTKDKISYAEPAYNSNFAFAFQMNAPNPVHGVKDQGSSSDAFQYRYLITLSCLMEYLPNGTHDGGDSGNTLTLGRLSGANIAGNSVEVVNESGTNGKAYNNAGTSTARTRNYATVGSATAIGAGTITLTEADFKSMFSTAAGVTNNLAARHFTHASVYRTRDLGAAGLALGNSAQVYYWVADCRRYDVFAGGFSFADNFSDDIIQNNGIILKTQDFTPMPSGDFGEISGGWMFCSDRTSAKGVGYINYCQTSDAENVGYNFSEIQKIKFNQPVTGMRANQDILSVFCTGSTHIVNLTSVNSDASKLQYIPFLTYIHPVDRKIGVTDWGTIDSVDENSMIAVCNDGSVRKWDTTKWGPDLAYNKVSTEIKQIVTASKDTYERGSVGKYFDGAYYLWYSKDSSDTITTHCLRYGFGDKAGYGWGFYDNFPQPMFKRGVVVYEDLGYLAMNVITNTPSEGMGGSVYMVETYRSFEGSVFGEHYLENIPTQRCAKDFMYQGDDPAGGSFDVIGGDEISSVIKFRELIGNSESDVLVHDETFHRWRPLSETDGYRSGMNISMSAYKDGSTTAFETITQQPRTGALKFTKEVAARRVQLAISTDVGGWRYVGIDSNFRSLDKVNYAVSGDNSSSESTTSYPQFQAEWADDLDLWLTRREEGLDRATGVQMTPASSGRPELADGPDSKTDSAYYFNGVATAHDYTEAWTAQNSYWTYDGDDDFATFPGYFASDAAGSTAIFDGGSLFAAFPLTNTTYPFKQRHRLRCLSDNSTNTALCIFDIAADAGFAGDFVEFIVQYQDGNGHYYVEEIGVKNGVPVDNLHDTGIVRVADVEFLIDIEVNSTGWKFRIVNYNYSLSDTGYVFPTIGFMDVNVQRTDATNQGMLKDSRIYTEQGGTSDARYDEDASNTYAADFSASFWFKGYAYDRDILRIDGTNPLYFQLNDSTHLDVTGLGTATLTAVGSGWNHIFVRRVGTSITVYQNGTLKATISDSGPTSLGGGDKHVGLSNGVGYLADVRVFSDDKSVDSNTYYYNNVINEQGDMVMPQV